MDVGRILAAVRTEAAGLEHVEKARAGGRGLVLALPHSGNWDIAGVWCVDFLGGPFMTVAERLEPESLFERFVEYRERLGIRVLPLTGGPRPSMRGAGGTGWATAGRPAWSSTGTSAAVGWPVEFFGRTATMPPGAALLASQTGAALMPDHRPVHRRLGQPFSPAITVTAPASSRTG